MSSGELFEISRLKKLVDLNTSDTMKLTNRVSKILMVALSIVIISEANGQEESKLQVYMGFQAAPNYSYRVLSNSSNDPNVDNMIEFLNNRESTSLGFRFAGVIGVEVFKRWTAEAGISYLRNRTQFELISEDESGIETGIGSDQDYDNGKLINSLDYLGIPMRIIYNLGTETLRIRATFGFTPQILLSQNTKIKLFKDGENTIDQSFQDGENAVGFNLSPLIGMGAEYSLNDQFTLTAEGIARFGLVNTKEDSPINSYTYSSELNVGLNYYFLGR